MRGAMAINRNQDDPLISVRAAADGSRLIHREVGFVTGGMRQAAWRGHACVRGTRLDVDQVIKRASGSSQLPEARNK